MESRSNDCIWCLFFIFNLVKSSVVYALFSFCTYVCKIWNNDLTEYQVWYKLTELLKAFRHFLTANRKKRRSKEYLFIVLAVKESFERFSCLVVHSLQCRRFLWALNLLAKATCWNFPKRGAIFHCQKIKDGGYNNITNTNKVSPTQNTPAVQATLKCDRRWLLFFGHIRLWAWCKIWFTLGLFANYFSLKSLAFPKKSHECALKLTDLSNISLFFDL